MELNSGPDHEGRKSEWLAYRRRRRESWACLEAGALVSSSHVLTSAAQRHGVAILRSLTQEAGELLSEERHGDRWCESEVVWVFAGVRWCRRER